MTDHVDPILDELYELDRDDIDPPTALAEIAKLGERASTIAAEYVRVRARAIHRARRVELTWREIGDIFGVSLQRAEAMSKQGTTERTPA